MSKHAPREEIDPTIDLDEDEPAINALEEWDRDDDFDDDADYALDDWDDGE